MDVSAKKDGVPARVAASLKDRRERQSLSLRALAAMSGISASMISDIERGAKSPTLTTLAALAEALAVPLPALIEGTAPAAGRLRVVRASERAGDVDPVSGARRDSFGPAVAGSRVEFLRYAVPPRTLAGPFPAHARGTIEHVHLAAGRVRVVLGSEAVELNAGDSCSCLAEAPHCFDNRMGETEALMYLVVEPS